MWQRMVRLTQYWLWRRWRKTPHVNAAIRQVIEADEAARKRQEYQQAEEALLTMRENGELVLPEDEIRAIMAQAYDREPEVKTASQEKKKEPAPEPPGSTSLSAFKDQMLTATHQYYEYFTPPETKKPRATYRTYTAITDIPVNASKSGEVVYITDERTFYFVKGKPALAKPITLM